MTQYDCAFDNLAPAGCTQYFFGPTSGSVQTYNFAGGQHLANQKQQGPDSIAIVFLLEK